MNQSFKDILVKVVFSSFVTSFLFLNCAREVAPTGGEKDVTPPKVLKMKPENNTRNFDQKRVMIQFDEFISMKAITENLVVSPPLETKPEVKQKGKKIIIDLSESELKDSTTYSLDFGASIADLNEGNILYNFNYIFSTGDNLDTLRVKGRIKDAYTHEMLENVTISLYRDLTDSAPAQIIPDYRTKLNKRGEFEFLNLQEGEYRLFANDDGNRNYLYDQPTEKIGFVDSILSPTAVNETVFDTISVTDTIVAHMDSAGFIHLDTLYIDSITKRSTTVFSPDPFEIFLFTPENNVQYITSYERKRKEKLDFVFSQSLFQDSLSVTFKDSAFKGLPLKTVLSPHNDSLTVWFTDSLLLGTDTVGLLISYIRYDSTNTPFLHTDTVTPRYQISKDRFKGFQQFKFAFSARKNSAILPNQKISFSSSIPVEEKDFSRTQLYSTVDTTGIKNRVGEFYEIDTARKEINISIHKPKYEAYEPDSAYNEQRIVQSKYAPHRFMLRFGLPVDPHKVVISLDQKPEASDWYTSEYDPRTNRLYYWITDEDIQLYNAPTIKVTYPLLDGSITEETIQFGKGKPHKKRKSPKNSKLSYYMPKEQTASQYLDETATVIFANPLASIDTSLMSLVMAGDTSLANLPATFTVDEEHKRSVHIHFEWQKGQTYIVNLKKHAVTDVYGTSNKDFLETIKAQKNKAHKILTEEAFDVYQDSLYADKFWFSAQWDEEKKYRFLLEDSAFTDIFNKPCDENYIDFGISKTDKLGNLDLRITNVKTPLILVMMNSDKTKELQRKYSSDTGTVVFQFEHLKPSLYSFKVIEDVNNNRKWDTGDYYKRIQPEVVRFGQEAVDVQKNRDHIFDWDLSVINNETDKGIDDSETNTENQSKTGINSDEGFETVE